MEGEVVEEVEVQPRRVEVRRSVNGYSYRSCRHLLQTGRNLDIDLTRTPGHRSHFLHLTGGSWD